MRLVFAGQAWEDYLFWQAADPNVLERLNGLIKECTRTPFTGTGKPEPLRGDLKGWWSRRITLADRLVYRVTGAAGSQALEIAPCRFHYEGAALERRPRRRGRSGPLVGAFGLDLVAKRPQVVADAEDGDVEFAQAAP